MDENSFEQVCEFEQYHNQVLLAASNIEFPGMEKA